MFYKVQFGLFAILKFQIILWLISLSSLSLSYGEEVTTCQSDTDKAIALQWPLNGQKNVLNSDNWLSIKDLSSNELNHIVWVDVRTKSERSKASLSNALNLSVHELTNANFLKDKKVIVIGNEFDQANLDSTVNQLKMKGFKSIYALQGGAREWSILHHHTSSVSNEISAKDLLLGSKTIDWQVITLGISADDKEKLPEKITNSFVLSEQAIKEFIQFINNTQLTNHSFISVVLVATDDQTTKQLQQRLQPYLASTQIVWLHGGIENYQNYIKQQQQIIANKGRKLIRPCGLTF